MIKLAATLAFRLFRHEVKRGELTIIILAVVLAVASVLSLSLFSERLQSALNERSAEFIAADRQLRARQPVPDEWLAQAESFGLQQAFQINVRSMTFHDDKLALAEVHAVDSNYPLKGQVSISDRPFGEPRVTDRLPQPGEVWADARLLQQLGAQRGDRIAVGDIDLQISDILTELPDNGFSLFNTDPIVLMSAADIPQANITGAGARVNYKYFFTGTEPALSAYYDYLQPMLSTDIHRWQSVADDQSPLGASIRRAEQYFLLASLLAIILAATAIAVASQRFSQRHYDPVAIMKTLGASSSLIKRVFLWQIGIIALVGIMFGLAIGWGIQAMVAEAVAERVDISLQQWHWRPFWVAVFTGLLCSVMFSLYPLLQLFSVPPLRVLRQDLSVRFGQRSLQYALTGSSVFILMYAYSQQLLLSLILFGSGIALVAVLMVATLGLISAGRRLGQGRIGSWQLAWARIRRRAWDNGIQLISFSITLMLLLLVLVMRNDLVQEWQAQIPTGTPNYFLINIQDEQRDPMRSHFAKFGLELSQDDFYPFTRARFVAVNGESFNTELAVDDENSQSPRQEADRGLGREANLTWSMTLQADNEIISGEWFGERATLDEAGHYPVSVEEGIADRMDLELNDILTFNLAGQMIDVKITSIRRVNWQSFQPNFFFVLHPDAVRDYVPTYITSFYFAPEDKRQVTELMRPFQSVTLFDIEARLEQVRGIVSQVSTAVEFILVLVLIAGSLVLLAQVQSSMDERLQEMTILRTLGANGRLIRFSIINEFIIIGGCAGLLAAITNELSLYLLQTQLFQLPGSWHIEYWLIAPLVGALVVATLGAVGCSRLLSMNTSALLRRVF